MASSTRHWVVLAIASLVSAQAAPPSAAGGAAGAGSAGAGSASPQSSGPPPAEVLQYLKSLHLDQVFSTYILILLGCLAAAIVVWRVTTETVKYVRKLTCLNNDTQRYFVSPSPIFASFKKHLLYAPIFRKRHNREFRLSTAVNVGTLPTRFQLLFLLGYLGTNVAICTVQIDFSGPLPELAVELRNRTGTIAVLNMIPLFAMSGRNNPFIKLLNLSFDSFNLLHRWFGRIVALEVLTHAICQVILEVSQGSWNQLRLSITTDSQIMFGFITFVAMMVIMIQSNSIIRHAFYETFKYIHIAMVILVVVALWYHLSLLHLPQQMLLFAVIGIWAVESLIRVGRVMVRNIGKGGTKTLVEVLPGNACRVTVDLARPWTFQPGQHAYLYMPALGLWTSHPFSVAWSAEIENLGGDKLAMNRQDILALQKTRMSFIIRARTGFTKKLYNKAVASPEQRFYTKCYAEGPYGGMHMMHSYGTVMLFAGGVGISHQVPHVRDLVAGFANSTVATRKVVLVWVIQSPEHLEWIRPWMTSILSMDRRRDVLRIMLFISRPRSTKEIHSPSATVQMFPGRPNVETLIDIELENQIGAMGVSVCGPGSLSDDVRSAIRARQTSANIDFIEEAFSW